MALLQRLQQRAGNIWEARLTRLLIEDDPHPMGALDVVQKDAKQALYKVGGTGYTRLVNHWLEHGDLYSRREGIEAAFKRPDAETIRLLEGLAAEGHGTEKEDGSDYDSRSAQLALARIGVWRSVVTTIVLWQGKSNREAIFARWGSEPLSDDDLEPALIALKGNPKHPGAIMSLGFGQRTDYSSYIVSILAEENVEVHSEVVNACVWALTMLQEVPPEAIGVLAPRLSRPEGRWLVLSLLMREAGPKSAKTLLAFLQYQLNAPLIAPYPHSIVDDAIRAAHFLLRNPATRAEASALCHQRIVRDAEPDFVAQRLIQSMLENEQEDKQTPTLLGDERTRDFLAINAFQDGGNIHYVGERAQAIRGLAAFDPADAYDAALRVLRTPTANDRNQSPQLLLELDRVRGVRDLMQHLTTERKTLMRRTCARALCAKGASDALCERDIKSSDPLKREAACFTLGFALPSGEVVSAVRVCLEDEDVRVFEAACEALRRLHATRCADELVAAYLASYNESERWVLLDAALEVGDVFDVNWLQRMLYNSSPLTAEYAWGEVSKRRKDEEEETAREDWSNHVE